MFGIEGAHALMTHHFFYRILGHHNVNMAFAGTTGLGASFPAFLIAFFVGGSGLKYDCLLEPVQKNPLSSHILLAVYEVCVTLQLLRRSGYLEERDELQTELVALLRLALVPSKRGILDQKAT